MTYILFQTNILDLDYMLYNFVERFKTLKDFAVYTIFYQFPYALEKNQIFLDCLAFFFYQTRMRWYLVSGTSLSPKNNLACLKLHFVHFISFAQFVKRWFHQVQSKHRNVWVNTLYTYMFWLKCFSRNVVVVGRFISL